MEKQGNTGNRGRHGPAKGGYFMKKKLLSICLVLTCCLSACGEETAGNGGQSTGGGIEQGDMVQQPENGGNSGAGENTQYNTQGAFGDASMEELKAAVVEVLGEDYWPNMAADTEILSETYGISEDMYDDFLAEMPMISTNVDTMIIIKAKEGKEEAVEEVLNDYRDKLVNDSFQYPMNIGKVQASRIEVFDNYVCFVQLGGDVTELLDMGDDIVITHCQEQNEKALDAIRVTLAE